jgi:hypothetical protein
MSPPAKPPANPALIAVWVDRHRSLGELIEQRPHDPSFWVWTIRHRILGYLLHRYGSQICAGDLMRMPADPSQDKNSRTSPAAARDRRQQPASPVRAASAFRSTLDHLRELNEARYAVLAEEHQEVMRRKLIAMSARIVRLTFPESKHVLLCDETLLEQRPTLCKDLEWIFGSIPEVHALTEEEIVALLSDKAD